MRNFKFSLFRMFMAVTVFCMAFAFVRWIGAPWSICPWLIGVPMAGVILLVKWEDERAIVATLFSCGVGAFVFLMPAAAVIGLSRTGGRDFFIWILVGTILGWVIGLFFRAMGKEAKFSEEDELDEEDEGVALEDEVEEELIEEEVTEFDPAEK